MFYLRKKVLHQPLPPNRIIEVANLYAYHPDQLAERYKPPWGNINEWFYFTNINPINNGEEGSGTERGVMRGGEYGYWKQTAEGEEEIKSEEGRKIGYKKTLVFYQLNGSHPDGSDGVETDWMMYEYRLAVPDQQPPPPPKRKRQQLQLQLQLHTFIFIPSSSSSSSFLPKRKIIGGGYNRKTALPFYQPSLSHPLGAPVLKPNLIVQELITVANPPILTTHHHNMRLDECCTVLCRIFKSSNGGSTSSSSSSTNDASTSSPGSSSNIPRVLELHTTTTTTTDQTNDDHLTATGQIECLQEEFTDHAHSPFVNIPHTLQNQQQQEQQQPINVHEVPPQVPHTNLQVLPPAGADDASTSTSTSTIPKHKHTPDDHTPHQDNGPFL